MLVSERYFRIRRWRGIVENYTLCVDGEADDTTRCDDRKADDQRCWMTLRDRIRILPVIKLARRAAFEMPPENFVV
jgi:hypothetical protein